MDVQRELGYHHKQICNCLKNRQKTAKGFKWKYADDYERIPFKVFDLEIYRKKTAIKQSFNYLIIRQIYSNPLMYLLKFHHLRYQ